MSRSRPATGYGCFRTNYPAFSKDFDGKAYSNVLKVFDICLELPSDSEKCFGFVGAEFFELVRNRKSRFLRHMKNYLWLETHSI